MYLLRLLGANNFNFEYDSDFNDYKVVFWMLDHTSLRLRTENQTVWVSSYTQKLKNCEVDYLTRNMYIRRYIYMQ